jgi:cation diffusion facilitator family transporter
MPKINMSDTRELNKVTLVSVLADIAITLSKGAFGIITNSQTLIADAVHSVADIVADIGILVGIKYWQAPADKKHPYGHFKIEAVISLFISFMILFAGLAIVYHVIVGFFTGASSPEHSFEAFAVVVVSIIVKEILFRYTYKKGVEQQSQATVANAWNHRSDVYSSIPVAVTVLASAVFPKVTLIDSIGAIGVSILIMYSALSVFKDALSSLIDEQAPKKIRAQIERVALETEGVLGMHELIARRSGRVYFVTMHIQVGKNTVIENAHAIAGAVKEKLLKINNIADVIIHIEPYEE